MVEDVDEFLGESGCSLDVDKRCRLLQEEMVLKRGGFLTLDKISERHFLNPGEWRSKLRSYKERYSSTSSNLMVDSYLYVLTQIFEVEDKGIY